MKELGGFAAGTGSGIGIRLLGAPWWAVILMVLVMSAVFGTPSYLSFMEATTKNSDALNEFVRPTDPSQPTHYAPIKWVVT